eukprot:2035646-Prymnesium_polylepis.2
MGEWADGWMGGCGWADGRWRRVAAGRWRRWRVAAGNGRHSAARLALRESMRCVTVKKRAWWGRGTLSRPHPSYFLLPATPLILPLTGHTRPHPAPLSHHSLRSPLPSPPPPLLHPHARSGRAPMPRLADLA